MRKGWEIKKWHEVLEIRSGRNQTEVECENGEYPILGSAGKVMGYAKKYISDEGSILIGRKGTINNPLFIPYKYWNVDTAFGIHALQSIDNRFLYYFCKNYDFTKEDKGSGRPSLVKTDLLKIEMPIPPLPEQQEIVSILDDAFESIERTKSNAEKNLKNSKELFECYLKNIFNTNEAGWINSTIGETCNLQTGGTPSTSKKEYYDGGSIKWLVSGDINQKVIEDCEGRITEAGMKNSNTKYLPVNSVLIALNGQGKTRGTVAMLRTKATCNQSLVSIFPKNEKELLPELVFSNLEGRYEEIRKMTGDSGNDRRGLNMPLIRSIKFSYPKSISIQKQVIKKLDLLRSEIKKIDLVYQQKINDLEELKKSILQKAFNGELKTSKTSS